jgi:hypothetical protein
MMSGYEQILIIWGIGWMLFGTGLMYLVVRVMAADSRQVERDQKFTVMPTAKHADEKHPSLAA